MDETKAVVKLVAVIALALVALAAAIWSVRRFTKPPITPQQAYEIQKQEMEGLAKTAPPNPTPGKYQPPKGFQPPPVSGK